MGERRGTKGLELWCRRMTEGYPGVNVTNMTTSWRDGLAFCAIIHHFRPDLIEFSKLNKDDIYHNNELAFRVAEHHLGIPALLEPEDMVEFPVPDRLSILTYLSQYYQAFVVDQGKSTARIPAKRPATSPDHGLVTPPSTSPPAKAALSSAGKVRREPCAKCGLPVFLAERLNVGKQLYHRTCFRCARCSSQLTLANYYETENGDFCCETCPDEEAVLTRSLSDEEKSASLKADDYSTKFETALESIESLSRSSTLKRYDQARSNFITQMADEDEPPDLPTSKPPEVLSDSGFPTRTFVNKDSFSVGNEESQQVVTKDAISAEGETNSLVRARMRLFEKAEETNDNQVPEIPSPVSHITISDDSVFTISDTNETSASQPDDETPPEEDPIPIVVDDESPPSLPPSEEIKPEEISTEEPPKADEPSPPPTLKEEQYPNVLNPEEISTEEPPKAEEPSLPPTLEEEQYPDELNPFDDEEESSSSVPPKPEASSSLNPFGEDEEEEEVLPSPMPAARKKITPATPDYLQSPLYTLRVSINPFDEEEEGKKPPQPAKRKVIGAPRISLNPFWSDDEENEDKNKPVPKPRMSRTSEASFGSLTSVASSQSGGGRKKKPAPRPPLESGASSLTSSPCHSVTQSPRATPKVRKNRKAPAPPTSTPYENATSFPNFYLDDDFEKEKFVKDEQNRNRQSLNLSLQSPTSSENSSSLGGPNKSTYGKWKKKKGQAPSRPIPQRRNIRAVIPLGEVRRELDLIEIQQQGLEKQGVRLEQIIRERCEGPDGNPDESLPPEIEEMVLQLFELVNEKNELFRRQAELMYLRRQQKLEEEHADLEYQIRCLMLQPEANKTDSDKAREEELIQRLVEVVERRNEIIECLEMDRVREAEEDDSINNQLNLYCSKKDDQVAQKSEKKEKKKHKKEKKFKLKGHKVDADKDIDEAENSTSPTKDKKKKKFNIF